MAPASPPAVDDAALDCRVFVTFFQLAIGVVVPTLFLQGYEIPLLLKAGAWPEGLRRSDRGRSGSDSDATGWVARAVQWPRRLAREVEATAGELCSILLGGAGSRVLTAASWAVLLSLMWMASVLLEQPA